MAKNEYATQQYEHAVSRYQRLFNAELYNKATQAKSNKYGNDLINEAMAMCGDPFSKLALRNWSAEALKFLEIFKGQSEFCPFCDCEIVYHLPDFTAAPL